MPDRTDARQGVTAEQVWETEPVLRRVVAARVRDPAAVDDLVQDALEHLLAARGRLGQGMMIPYGVVTARNLTVSHDRRAARARDLRPLFVDVDAPVQPDEAVLRDEERAAMTAALARLPEAERGPLLAHEVDGTPVTDLVDDAVSVGTMRARLARSRAKLRVEYVLSLRNIELPTAQCRPTLLVLAGDDRGRHRSEARIRHLLSCEVCASLSEPLIERRRGMVALLPLVGWRWIIGAGRRHPVSAAATSAATVAAVAGGAVLMTSGSPPSVPPTASVAVRAAARSSSPPSLSSTVPAPAVVTVPAGSLTVDGRPLLAGPRLGDNVSLAALVGHTVVVRAATVQSVVTHDGFWVGPSARRRVWVQLVGPLRPLQVTVGAHVSFVAPLVSQDATYAPVAGVDAAHRAAQLTAQGAHLAVATTDLIVTP